MVEQYSIVYMYHNFIHSSVDGHLGCSHVLATVNSAAVNIVVCMSFCNFIYFWQCWVFVNLCRLSLVEASGGCFVVAHGLLIVVASLVAEHRF